MSRVEKKVEQFFAIFYLLLCHCDLHVISLMVEYTLFPIFYNYYHTRDFIFEDLVHSILCLQSDYYQILFNRQAQGGDEGSMRINTSCYRILFLLVFVNTQIIFFYYIQKFDQLIIAEDLRNLFMGHQNVVLKSLYCALLFSILTTVYISITDQIFASAIYKTNVIITDFKTFSKLLVSKPYFPSYLTFFC